jgi:membrane associated rhomboid family serine protease
MLPVADVIPSRTRPVVTIGLLLASVGVFLWELHLEPHARRQFFQTFGVVPVNPTWVGTVTSAFVHDGWIQFASNTACLWIFGANVEDTMGRVSFLLFYISSAIVTTLVHVALHASSLTPLVGASGAIAAVMAAYFVLFPRSQVLTIVFLISRIDIAEVPAIFLLAAWLFLQLLSGAQAGAAFTTHMAGLLLGILTGLVVRRTTSRWEE